MPQDIRRRRKEGEGTLSKLCPHVSPLLPPPLLWAALKRGEEKGEAASASITWNGFPLPYARHFMRKTLGKEGGDFLGENLFAQQHLSPPFFREAEYLYFELQAHPAPPHPFSDRKKSASKPLCPTFVKTRNSGWKYDPCVHPHKPRKILQHCFSNRILLLFSLGNCIGERGGVFQVLLFILSPFSIVCLPGKKMQGRKEKRRQLSPFSSPTIFFAYSDDDSPLNEVAPPPSLRLLRPKGKIPFFFVFFHLEAERGSYKGRAWN